MNLDFAEAGWALVWELVFFTLYWDATFSFFGTQTLPSYYLDLWFVGLMEWGGGFWGGWG